MALIPFEIDEWNTNGASAIWVSVPSLSSSNDSVWAYWGNPAPAVPPLPASNVWLNAGYEIVYHLKETGFPYADSVGQYPANAGIATTQATGIVGHSQSFNGSAFLSPGAVKLNHTFTTSAWLNLNSSANNIQTIWASQVGGYAANGFSWFINTYDTSDRVMHTDSGDGAGNGADAMGATPVSTGQWHFVAATWDQNSSLVNMYLDGLFLGIGTAVSTFGLTNVLNLGAFLNPTFQFNGKMDEARIQSGVASSNWLWTSWATVAANANLQSYSSVAQQYPDLQTSSVPDGIVLSWPGSGVGFTLYSTTNLASPTLWLTVTNQPVLQGGQWQVNLPTNSSTARFYRLQSE